MELKEPGDYRIRVKVRWMYNDHDDITISSYADSKIIMAKDLNPDKDFLTRFYGSL